jgi:type II secretory pathway pseudopilin PulG
MKRAFTIIELLGVMVVLATLFGLILPAMKLSIRTAHKKQATADATALAQAVIRYRQTYGFWPGPEAVGDDSAAPILIVGTNLPAWANLAALNLPAAGPAAGTRDLADVIRALLPSDDGANPRSIRFLDIPASRLSHDGLFIDPWGAPYAIVIHPPGEIAGHRVGWSEVVAFSFGPPGRIVSAADNLIFSAGVPR